MSQVKRSILVALCALGALAGLHAPAHGAFVTYKFSGVMSASDFAPPGFHAGVAFQGRLTFDVNAPASSGGGQPGVWSSYPTGVVSMWVETAGLGVLNLAATTASVGDNVPASPGSGVMADVISLGAVHDATSFRFGIRLTDTNTSAISDTRLPEFMRLSDWTTAFLTVHAAGQENGAVGSLVEFQHLPTPHAGALLAVGGVVSLRRRR